MQEYENYDALGLAELVRRKEVSAAELLNAAIARAEKHAALNAIVLRLDAEARAAINAGLPEGAFTGAPFLLKDLHVATPDGRLTNGSRLYENYTPDFSGHLALRYRRAGLVCFGRSASPEFGLTTTTESVLHGQTRNPWNTAHTAGGSSGGAGAAVAAGVLPLAHASDGGGSIRIPASCCGLFGLKPARGRTPNGPRSGEGWAGMSGNHAVSRTVRDSAALLDASAGPDAGAPYAAQPHLRDGRQTSWLEECKRAPGKLRVALQTQTFNGADTHPDCAAAAGDAAQLLQSLGHEVTPARFNPGEALYNATLTIISSNTRALIELRAGELEISYDAAAAQVEPGVSTLAERAQKLSALDYLRAVETLHATSRALAEHMRDFDLLLTPTMAAPPTKLGELSLSNPEPTHSAKALLQSIGFTQLANATGNPAASLPLYWNEAGLPIGVQLIARADCEAQLLQVAAQCEQARPWFERRPPAADAS